MASKIPNDANFNVSYNNAPKHSHYDLEAYSKPVFERLSSPKYFTGAYKQNYCQKPEGATHNVSLSEIVCPGRDKAPPSRPRTPKK